MGRSFEGTVAVVTGAASGIGEATARRLAAEGASVVCADIDGDGATRVASEIEGRAVVLDVRRMDAWEAALADVVTAHGRLDILHLNAGVMTRPPGAPLGDDPVPWLQPEGYEKVSAVNIDGVAYGLMAAIPVMTAGGGGDIVITASTAGLEAFPADAFYSMSKHAVIGLARGAGPALASRNIRVNAICPGGMDTRIVPPDLRAAGMRFSPPSYLADAVVTVLRSAGTGEVWIAFAEGVEPWRYEFRSVRP